MFTHPLSRKNNRPMSSKIITSVLTVAIVGPFAYAATMDAVSITQNLHDQSVHIEKLNTEQAVLDNKLDKTVEVKEKTVEEVQELETKANDATTERQKLEAELGVTN